MTECKEASTPTVMTTTLTTASGESLDSNQHSQYRIVVGQRQWEAPVRPDCAFTIKEPSRNVNEPAVAHFESSSIFYDTSKEHFVTKSYCNESSSSNLQANTSSSLSSQWTQTGQDVQ